MILNSDFFFELYSAAVVVTTPIPFPTNDIPEAEREREREKTRSPISSIWKGVKNVERRTEPKPRCL